MASGLRPALVEKNISALPFRDQQLMISARHHARRRYDLESQAHFVFACVVLGAT